MAVQKSKVSPSRRNNRRAHDALKKSNYKECENCGELTQSHHVCRFCGYYSGRQVVSVAVNDEAEATE